MRALIITADDFGFSPAVNEAVEDAHVRGVLGTASLMVGARAATDALERARRLPGLSVGLHIVLAGSWPVSPLPEIPELVGADGRLSSRLFAAGMNYFFRPSVKQQLEREVRAQFELFREYGLELDHVNCHKHLHLNPAVFDIILKVGADYGLRAVRFPYEPVLVSCRASRKGKARKIASWLFLLPWTVLLRRKIRAAKVLCNDYVFGLGDTGRMELSRALLYLEHLPQGVSEMYFHPAARYCPELAREAPGALHVQEFEALTAPTFSKALDRLKIKRVSFCELPLKY